LYPTFTIFFQVLILLNFDSNLLQESSDQQSELARDTYPKEVLEPGAQLPGIIICFVVLVLGLFFCAEDLATQVYFWDAYKRACRLARTRRGKFVSPDVAEFLVGG